MKFDTAILGSGISGMTSALLQARRGRRVVLLEQASHLAPLISGFDRAGAHFETGLHYCAGLGPGEPGRRLFESLGIDVPVRPCNPEGYGEIRLMPTGRRFALVSGRDRLIAHIADAFPGEAQGAVQFLEKMHNEAARSPFLNMGKGDFTPTFTPWPSRTLQEELDAHFRSPELKAIFAASTFLHGVPPARVSFSLHSHMIDGMHDSVWEIDGGGRSLVAAFRTALEAHGVEILLRHEVTRLELREKAKLLHCANGSTIAADQCISTLDAKAFLEIAPPELYRPGHKRRMLEIPGTAGFLCMYARVAEKAYPGNTVFVLPDLDYNQFSPDGAKTVYEIHYSHSSPRTASIVALAPEARQLADRNAPDYRRRKAEAARARWDELAAWCPDLMAALSFVTCSTPATQKYYTGYASGYGLAHDVTHSQILPMTKIPGVYLSGQSVVAPGLLGSMISAFLTDKIAQ